MILANLSWCVLVFCGCSPHDANPSAELEKLRPINQAFDTATALASQRMKDLDGSPNDERTAKSLQVYFATLEPALSRFLDAPPVLETDVETLLREWRRTVSELDVIYTEMMDSEDCALPVDEKIRVDELLAANEKVEAKISAYVYKLLDSE